jgi:hypothetical protein
MMFFMKKHRFSQKSPPAKRRAAFIALKPSHARLAYGAPRLPRSTRRPTAGIGSASSAMKALWLSKEILSLN